MTDPTRGVRQRRGARRPAWPLLTVLLVLAIVASSALVFTDRVELLKLAVIIALWAAVVGAFISFIHRRQSDVDQAKVRDLKLVYDLQLDREISARREYELSVESHLRRELTTEIRAQAADQVAALRAELATLRANLQVLFDTDLQDRPALETEHAGTPAFGKVISSRIDAERIEEPESDTDESPIIDVPEEPQPADYGWTPPPPAGGAHRRASQRGSGDNGWRPAEPPPPPPPRTPTPSVGLPWLAPESVSTPQPAPQQAPAPSVPAPSVPTPPVPPPFERQPAPAAREWQSAPSEPVDAPAPFSPAPAPAPPSPPTAFPPASPAAFPPASPAAFPPASPVAFPPASPAMAPAPAEPRRGRHGASDADPAERLRARHSSAGAPDPGRPHPTLATPPHANPVEPAPPAEPGPSVETMGPHKSRHRGSGEPDAAAGQHDGGQPLSELLARLQTGAAARGGGRRRRDD